MAEKYGLTVYDSLSVDFVRGIAPPQKPANSLLFLFKTDEMLVVTGRGGVLIPSVPDPEASFPGHGHDFHFLGWYRGVPCFAGTVTEKPANLPDSRFEKLRPLHAMIQAPMFAIAGMARQILFWAETHKFCGRCGKRTVAVPNERAMMCDTCKQDFYPVLAPAILAAVTREDKILLAWSRRWPQPVYSVIAGFVEPGETLEQCAAREVMEETAITVKNIRYFASQPWPFPNQLMVAFFAEYSAGDIRIETSELSEAAWFSRDRLPELPLPISLARILIDSWREKT